MLQCYKFESFFIFFMPVMNSTRLFQMIEFFPTEKKLQVVYSQKNISAKLVPVK